MIDKFNIETDIPEENELLGYVIQLMSEYCLYVDYDYDTGKSYFCGPFNPSSLYMFKNRYNENQFKIDFTYENYISNLDIQNTLKTRNLDAEKFWYLLLFICDYCYGECVDGYRAKRSSRDELDDLIKAIDNNIKGYKAFMMESDKELKLTLHIDKKQVIAINNPDTLFFLSLFCNSGLTELNKQTSNYTYSRVNKRHCEEYNSIESNSYHIYFFASMFIKFFELNPQFKAQKRKESGKLLLISRLIYFVKLSRNKNFNDGDETLKAYIKQYKNDKRSKFNDIYY